MFGGRLYEVLPRKSALFRLLRQIGLFWGGSGGMAKTVFFIFFAAGRQCSHNQTSSEICWGGKIDFD